MNRSNYRCVDYFADLGRMRCGCNDTPTCILRHKKDVFRQIFVNIFLESVAFFDQLEAVSNYV